MKDEISFGMWLKRRRIWLGITQSQLAQRTGYSVSLIQKIEANQRRPSQQMAEQLTSILSLPDDQPALLETLAAQERLTPRHHLPIPLTSFVDRVAEIRQLHQLCEHTRLMTLIGPGGVGKTRLALHLASERLQAFSDGVWLVELASLSDSALVPQAVAQVLGVNKEANRSLEQSLAANLTNRQLLLVLDNCEHVIDTCAQLATLLLRTATRLSILATSRIPLAIDGEMLFPVPPLAETDAVTLFSQRARAVLPDFTIDGSEEAVKDLCRRLDGLPLAIELAATRIRLLSVEQIISYIDRSLLLLSSSNRTITPRHTLLHALLDWSYALLNPTEQILFQELAVFKGGWSIEDAQSVVSTDQPLLKLLSSLLDNSLIQPCERNAKTPRFNMLETTRQYALEHLAASGSESEIRQRHALGFLQLAEAAEKELWRSQQVAWLSRLDCEEDNLRAALQWELASSEHSASERALRFVIALEWFWRIRGKWSEGRFWLMRALAHSRAFAPINQLHIQAQVVAGIFAATQYDLASATTLLEECILWYQTNGNKRGLGQALHNLGITVFYGGNYQRAWQLTEAGLTLVQNNGNARDLLLAISLLGEIALEMGDLTVAENYFHQAQDVIDQHSEQIENNWTQGWTYFRMALVVYSSGDLARLKLLLERCWKLFGESVSHHGIAKTRYLYGRLKRAEGDLSQARSLISESLAFHRYTQHCSHIASCTEELAAIYYLQGETERAARLYGAANALRERFQIPLPQIEQASYHRDLLQLRSTMSEQSYAAAWASGQQLTLQATIAEALSAHSEHSNE